MIIFHNLKTRFWKLEKSHDYYEKHNMIIFKNHDFFMIWFQIIFPVYDTIAILSSSYYIRRWKVMEYGFPYDWWSQFHKTRIISI